MQHSSLMASGRFEITVADAATKRPVRRLCVPNQLTEIHRAFRNALLTGQTEGRSLDDLTLRYFAFGDGVAAAAPSDTALGNERFRKQITQLTAENGAVRSICSLSAGEANFTIREIGVFGGSGASAAAGSGTLLARVAVCVEKNENLVLNIVRIDTTDL